MKRALIILLVLSIVAIAYAFSPTQRYVLPLHPQASTVDMVLHFKDSGPSWTGADPYLFDYSLNGTTGRLWGTAAPVFPGYILDGNSDYIFTSATLQTTFDGSFSITIWVKPDDGNPASDSAFVGTVSDTAPLEDRVVLQLMTTGKIRFHYESNDDEAYAEESVASFADGAQPWTCIVATAEADKALLIYVNGVLRTLGGAPADGDATGITFADYVTTCNVNFGAINSDDTPDGYHSYFAGLIGDCRVYSRVLPADEIKSFYEVTRWRYSE